ncbi:flavin reductase family protein [Desulfohalovibrio reitneri]|uniref:flavin reductase family protein n=1 Tax=Desulfohalovibrio reitneri TaxID=1307759 RepID=UPI0004A77759|nr:flavin reductase family protein [Desulfohalovibrio reitneri]
MEKTSLGASPLILPMPALLVGALVDGKPNFMVAAWAQVACSKPPMLSVAVREERHTMRGIRENGQFSLNVPSTALVEEADACGVATGAKTDKSEFFTSGYSELAPKAPLAMECPINVALHVEKFVELGSHTLVIGNVKETLASSSILKDGLPDPVLADPLVYLTGVAKSYARVGDIVGGAFKVGRKRLD